MRGRALLLATSHYVDPKLSELRSTAVDVARLRGVLSDPQVGDFLVNECLDATAQAWRERVEEFFSDASRDETLLLYISGHGVKDRDGRLHFAAADTKLNRLLSTGVAATFIQDASARSHSRRQVMLLDTCFSGAFAKGYQFKGGSNAIGSGQLLSKGGGKIVITASDEMQYAFEDDDIKGKPVPSVFTRHIVEGLASGLADVDGDGEVSVNDLYHYVSDSMRRETPQQHPQQWAFGLTGDLVLAANPKPRAGKLPPHVVELLTHPHPSVRETGIKELRPMLGSGSTPLALAALAELERLVDDDSRRVSAAAKEVLAAVPHPMPRAPAREPAESPEAKAERAEAFPDAPSLPERQFEPSPTPPSHPDLVQSDVENPGWNRSILRWLGGAAGALLTLYAMWFSLDWVNYYSKAGTLFEWEHVLALVSVLMVLFGAAYGTYSVMSRGGNIAVKAKITSVSVAVAAFGIAGLMSLGLAFGVLLAPLALLTISLILANAKLVAGSKRWL